jgi:putative ATPase
MIILAAEDISLADPFALMLATSAAQAAERIGLPEARIVLAEAAVYLALAPKSNSTYL